MDGMTCANCNSFVPENMYHIHVDSGMHGPGCFEVSGRETHFITTGALPLPSSGKLHDGDAHSVKGLIVSAYRFCKRKEPIEEKGEQ